MSLSIIKSLFFILILPISFLQAQDDLSKIEVPESNITIFTSKSYEGRGLALAHMITGVNDYIAEEVTGFKADILLKVYSSDDWSKYTFPGLVYGMPHFRDENSIIVAAEDNGFWKSLVPDPEAVPSITRETYIKTYTVEDGSLSSMAFFDLLSIHELGHLYQFQSEFKQQKYWLTEFYCNLLLHTAIAEAAPQYLNALEILPKIHAAAPTDGLTYTTLEQFEADYTKIAMEAPNNYGWYQFRFHDAARRVYDEAGKDAIVKLWQFHQSHKEVLEKDQLIALLKEEVHPAVAKFIEEW